MLTERVRNIVGIIVIVNFLTLFLKTLEDSKFQCKSVNELTKQNINDEYIEKVNNKLI